MNDIKYGQKKSSIRRHLKAKLEDWFDSITDSALVSAMKRDVIVTGGSICSMLMGDRVNDYDVYFRTKETTRRVAEYYVNLFNERNNTTSKYTKPYTPVVRDMKIVNCKGVEEERISIYIKSAGVVGENQETYRYFEGWPADEAEEFAESLAKDLNDKNQPPYRPIFLSQNAISLSDKVQVVIRFFGEPDEIHNNYDFAHAMCWYTYHNNHLELKQEALECMLSRTLIYRGSLYPIASIFRMKKFIERGWRITAGQQLKIMWQINELNLRDPQQLYEQLTGVDMAYMYQLIQALQDVDPEKINSAYISVIIDRIFE